MKSVCYENCSNVPLEMFAVSRPKVYADSEYLTFRKNLLGAFSQKIDIVGQNLTIFVKLVIF